MCILGKHRLQHTLGFAGRIKTFPGNFWLDSFYMVVNLPGPSVFGEINANVSLRLWFAFV